MGKANAAVEAQNIEIDGLPIRYLAAGEGPPLVLLHGAGDNSLDWRWVIPDLVAAHRVYAPDLPGSPDSARLGAAFFERFAVGFLDALGIRRATFVGNSLGGLIALRLALSEPARVTALALFDSGGLGSAVNPAFTSVNVPLLGESAMPFWRTRAGAYQRVWGGRRCSSRIPPEAFRASGWPSSAGWRARQATWRPPDRAPRPGGSLRPTRGAGRPPRPTRDADACGMGECDRVFSRFQAKRSVVRLRDGSLALIPDCGHMPHVECPDRFLGVLDGFLLKRVHR